MLEAAVKELERFITWKYIFQVIQMGLAFCFALFCAFFGLKSSSQTSTESSLLFSFEFDKNVREWGSHLQTTTGRAGKN